MWFVDAAWLDIDAWNWSVIKRFVFYASLSVGCHGEIDACFPYFCIMSAVDNQLHWCVPYPHSLVYRTVSKAHQLPYGDIETTRTGLCPLSSWTCCHASECTARWYLIFLKTAENVTEIILPVWQSPTFYLSKYWTAFQTSDRDTVNEALNAGGV